MRKLQKRDTDRLASTQSEAMNDLCTIYHVSYVTGSYSDDETQVLTGTFNVECGIQLTNGQIQERGQLLVVDYDAVLRLPSSQLVGLDDRIVLTEKGNTQISGTFMVHGYPVVNSSIQHIKLKRELV
jgi:hypothetical protein